LANNRNITTTASAMLTLRNTRNPVRASIQARPGCNSASASDKPLLAQQHRSA
jgi:hypothetical protein